MHDDPPATDPALLPWADASGEPERDWVDRLAKVMTFLAALAVLALVIALIIAAGAWIFSEGFMRLFPADYGRFDS